MGGFYGGVRILKVVRLLVLSFSCWLLSCSCSCWVGMMGLGLSMMIGLVVLVFLIWIVIGLFS